MIRRTGIILWILVLIAGGFWIYAKSVGRRALPLHPPDEALRPSDGRLFVTMPWKRLPQMQQFRLTNTDGQTFDNATLNGKPYVVSFFFANCPTICRDLNRQIARLAHEFQETDLHFVSLTVDPDNDTPARLRDYAGEFEADSRQWEMLTGPMHRIRAVGENQFNVVVDGEHHTGDLFLVDRWGRYRDRFSWDDARELKRFGRVAREVLAENAPPLDQEIRTRNVLASLPHADMKRLPWLFDFQLTDQDGEEFWSRDLTGQVQIVSFFFSSCPGICPRQNRYLAEIQAEIGGRNAWLVSITTDPQRDDPATLRQYARSLAAGDRWKFLTGDLNYIRRTGSEFLGIAAEGEHHSSRLVVIDRWGNVRARIDWEKENATPFLLELIDRLGRETVPAAGFEIETNAGGHE